MDYLKITNTIVSWIKEKVEKAKAEGVLVGLSGGIDSAVVMALCQKAFPNNCIGIIMPCYSNPKDEMDAKILAEHLQVPYQIINLGKVYDSLLQEVTKADKLKNVMALANIKPRLRMTTLYYEAALRNYLVAGTGNKSEIEIGYYTKYGDGGVDFEPIGELVKTQVRELAKYLQIPGEIINKAPSAGLWTNQTDESEMGFTYEELDNYILTGQAEPNIKVKIENLKKISEHKRHLPPCATLN
ncbi:NAD(+) synthase [Bacillota bacterium LX-D]|nr:NAD(+) synthase [Bacillota bacterium LX-D]